MHLILQNHQMCLSHYHLKVWISLMRSKGTKCDWTAQEQNKTKFLFSYSNKLRVDHLRHETYFFFFYSNKVLLDHLRVKQDLLFFVEFKQITGGSYLPQNRAANHTQNNNTRRQQNCQWRNEIQLMYLSTKLSIKRQNTTYSFSTNDALKHGHGVFVLLWLRIWKRRQGLFD